MSRPRPDLTNNYRRRPSAAWSTHRSHHRGEVVMAAVFCLLVAFAIWRDTLTGLIPGDVLITTIDIAIALVALTAVVIEVAAWRKCRHPLDAVGGVTCPHCGADVRARLSTSEPDETSAGRPAPEIEDRPGRSRARDV